MPRMGYVLNRLFFKLINVIFCVSFAMLSLSGLVGVVCEVWGYKWLEQMLSQIGITYSEFWLSSLGVLVLCVCSYQIKSLRHNPSDGSND